MKEKIKRILREEVSKLVEDYPESFDMELFKELDSFKKRVHYAKEELPKIAAGSSRTVFKIDDEKVLKLAHNMKGIAQNETEVEHYEDPVTNDIFAKVYNYDEKYKWIEMQLAKKMKKADFERIVGVNMEDFFDFVRGKGHPGKAIMDKEKKEELWENEFARDVVDYIGNFNVPPDDLTRKNSYGIVEDNGEERVVIIDYGLSSNVYECYYC